jgi:hypothetical protein
MNAGSTSTQKRARSGSTSDGGEFTSEDEDRIRELAAFAGATLDAFRAARC